MAGSGPADLIPLAASFLFACEEALDTIPNYAPTLAGGPSRIYLSAGAPAFDCDQLTVHIGPLGEGAQAPLKPKASIARINRVTLIATSVRCCMPTGSLDSAPSVAALEAVAEQVNADKWALWNHVWNLIAAGLLFTLCGDVEWLGLTPLPLAGGCGGNLLTVRVGVDGYEEVLGT